VIEETALPGRLGRKLWAYLVLNRRRPVGRGEIAGALWGDDEPDAADASVNALISRLRSVLARFDADERAELRTATGSYTLVLPADAFVDRERAWGAIQHVQAVRRRGDAAAAWAEAVIAHEIAARGFLPGEVAEWIEAERRTLRDIELQALEAIVEAEIDQRRAPEAERAALYVTGKRSTAFRSRAGPSSSAVAATPCSIRACATARWSLPSSLARSSSRSISSMSCCPAS